MSAPSSPIVARLTRRGFLRVVTVTAAAVAGCGPSEPAGPPSPEEVDAVFPQGIASADPEPHAVTLWVRAVPPDGADTVDVRVIVAADEALEMRLVDEVVEAHAEDDHTLRVYVEGLTPHTRYYYRFEAAGVPSPVGRTRTAPTADMDVPVRVAVASCQEYVGRWYHAYKALAQEDPEPDFVLFLGDYIYETIADPRFQPADSPRGLSIPDGLSLDGTDTNLAAWTLADYRALYRQYRSDPDLKEIHRRFPFVAIWDDHEFTNDCWQDVANEFDGERGIERETERRMAATRAWAEYVPSSVARRPEGVFPNDIDRVYRRLRWGRHVDLWLTDSRSFRDDHAVPEDAVVPQVGKYTKNTPVGSRILAIKEGFDTYEAGIRPTMLGPAQRDWLVAGLSGSDATWKVWVSPLMVAQMVIDLRDYEELPGILRQDFYFKLDQWDGFRSERREILEQIAGLPGLVVLSGDLHGNYAAELRVDFDAPDGPAIGTEFTITGVSSISLQEQLDTFASEDPGLAATALSDITPMFDMGLLARGPHFHHAHSSAYGYGLAEFGPAELLFTFVEVTGVTDPTWNGQVRRRTFRVTPTAPVPEPVPAPLRPPPTHPTRRMRL